MIEKRSASDARKKNRSDFRNSDTKGKEIKYLRDRILESGGGVILLDNGVLGEPHGIVPDIPGMPEILKAALGILYSECCFPHFKSEAAPGSM